MFLYELAIALDVRSVEMTERAKALGLDGIGPTSDLTADQVAQLRAAYGHAVDPGPSRGMPPMGGSGQQSGPMPPTPPKGARSGGGVALIGMVIVLTVGLFGVLVVKGNDDSRGDRAAQELQAFNDAPEVTLGEGGASPAASTPLAPDQSADEARYCAGFASMTRYELQLGGRQMEEDWAKVRDLAADRTAWNQGLMDMAVSGPADIDEELEQYRAVVSAHFDGLAASTSLRDMQVFLHDQGPEGIRAAEEALYELVVPTCGLPPSS